jgi:mRNA interferase YafQ
MELFEEAFDFLVDKGSLPPKYKTHPLIGNWYGHLDAHIAPDWILIFKVDGADVIFTRMGTHSDLF